MNKKELANLLYTEIRAAFNIYTCASEIWSSDIERTSEYSVEYILDELFKNDDKYIIITNEDYIEPAGDEE